MRKNALMGALCLLWIPPTAGSFGSGAEIAFEVADGTYTGYFTYTREMKTARIHQEVTKKALKQVSAQVNGVTKRFTDEVIADIISYNINSDLNDLVDVDFVHFDNETLERGTARVIGLKNQMLAALTQTVPDGPRARKHLGELLHTLQDFYSHTNWVERGNTEPFPFGVFPRPAVILPAEQITTACNLFGTNPQGPHLTSGYWKGPEEAVVGPVLPVYRNNIIKCRHGLPSPLFPGINKDLPGRAHHDQALALAERSTRDFVQHEILGNTGLTPMGKCALLGVVAPECGNQIDIFDLYSPSVPSTVISATNRFVNAYVDLGAFTETYYMTRFCRVGSEWIPKRFTRSRHTTRTRASCTAGDVIHEVRNGTVTLGKDGMLQGSMHYHDWHATDTCTDNSRVPPRQYTVSLDSHTRTKYSVSLNTGAGSLSRSGSGTGGNSHWTGIWGKGGALYYYVKSSVEYRGKESIPARCLDETIMP